MKKPILQILLALLPFFSFAQYGVNWNQSFAGDDHGLADVGKLDDDQHIVTMNIDDKTFEVFPVDDKLNIPWRTTLPGYPLYSGPFKGGVLVIANEFHRISRSAMEGHYTAYLLDAKTGKQELTHDISGTSGGNNELVRAFFSPDGSAFKLLIENFHIDKYKPAATKEPRIIDDLSLVSLSDNLEPKSIKLALPADKAIQVAFNSKGDLFLLTEQPRGFAIMRYEAGQSQPSAPITQSIAYLDDFNFPAAMIGSNSDRKICYFSFTYKTPDKDMALEIGKADFNKQTCQATSETFDKVAIKSIEKNTAPISKMLKETTFGWLEGLLPIHLEEYNGGLVVNIAERYLKSRTTISTMQTGGTSEQTSYGSVNYGVLSSFIIECFDSQFKKTFQQVLPNFANLGLGSEPQYIVKGDKLYFDAITEYKDKVFPLFCELDLKTGAWIKTDLMLDREDKDYKSYHPLLDGTLWFNDCFAVPYMIPVGGFHAFPRYSYELQQNKY